jgi:hypothetical protein
MHDNVKQAQCVSKRNKLVVFSTDCLLITSPTHCEVEPSSTLRNPLLYFRRILPNVTLC